MTMAGPGQLNVIESPSRGSRSVDCFEKLEQIGEGTYGMVYMAREIETGEIVALKKIRMDNEREGFPITAIREIKILKKLHHENVIKLKEIVTSPGPEKDDQGRPDGNKYKGGIYMVFEYMDHDLTGLADRPGMRFTVPQIKCYMRQLLTGLHYCHVNQVLHRDIKGSNLLIDNEGNLKLADFGLARSFSNEHNANLTNRVITLWYRPPELLLGTTRYGPAVDMWSVGCIFAELLHGKPIFPGKDEPEQLNKIFELCGAPDEVNWPGVTKTPWYNQFKPSRPMKRRLREVFRHFDRHALELLEKMLTLDPAQRIPAKDALDAEYFWTDPLPCDPKRHKTEKSKPKIALVLGFVVSEQIAMAAAGQLNVIDSPSRGSRSVDCFEKLEQIGEGTYGQVYMAKEIETGEIVALKKIRMDNEREGFPITAIREIKILKKLHHENVIKLKEIVTSPGPEKDDQGRPDGNKYKGGIYMVFDYMDHDLTGLADRPGMRFTVPQIKCYMRQLLTGLHYCHVNQVLHRDIKGSNLLIDNEGNLKLADFGLARSFSNEHNANLTNRVITLWYRPPELLLGTTRYGPAVDMWSVGCIFAELLHGKPIFPGKDEPEQLNKIFELCGAPDEVNWPGVQKTPWYNQFKPTRPMKRRLREVFRHFDRHALELLEKMLTLDPAQRISAKDALDAEYFWTDPLPCDPKSLPKYESSHEFQTKKKRQQQRQNEENAKRLKMQHPQQHTRLPPIQQGGHHAQMRQGPTHPSHASQPAVAAGPSHHYGKPRPSGGPGRYPPGGNPSGGYNHPNRGGQGGGAGYGSGPYPPQGRGAPYGSGGMPAGPGGPRGGGGSGYGVGGPNYPQGGPPHGGSAAGRGSNMMGGNRNQQYGWQQ